MTEKRKCKYTGCNKDPYPNRWYCPIHLKAVSKGLPDDPNLIFHMMNTEGLERERPHSRRKKDEKDKI